MKFNRLANIEKVTSILHEIDPMGFESDQGEYEVEAIEIANRSFALDTKQLAWHVKNVFDFWFFKDALRMDTCVKIATRIHEVIDQQEN